MSDDSTPLLIAASRVSSATEPPTSVRSGTVCGDGGASAGTLLPGASRYAAAARNRSVKEPDGNLCV